MSIRILVVDDNVDIINNVREYLSLKGWTIEWCTTGPDALRRLQADPFDLLILDLGFSTVSPSAANCAPRTRSSRF